MLVHFYCYAGKLKLGDVAETVSNCDTILPCPYIMLYLSQS